MNKKNFSFDHSGDNEDFEFDFDSPRRKPILSKGRRSESSSGLSNTGFPTNDANIQSTSPESSRRAPLPPSRLKKTGGWAEENSSTSKMNWLRRVSRSSPSKQTPKKETRSNQDSDNEIPIIPNLDDVYQEEFSTQIANAPSVAVHRVMTYQELDNDLSRNTVFQSLDGIDLRILTKHLGPEQKVKEEDIPWTWDMLLTDVSSHLNEKKDTKSPIIIKKLSNNIAAI